MRTLTGHRYLAEALQAYGVSHVFMVPTVAVMALAEMDRLGVIGIMTHSEKAAAYMADGYARATNKPGICLAQTVGATNLLSGLRDAFITGSPVIALTGGTEPMTRYKYVYQELEDFPSFEKLTKFNAQVQDVRRVPDLLRQAFREAVSGSPGPVHLELQGITGNVLDGTIHLEEATEVLAEDTFARSPAFRPRAEEASVERAVELLLGAVRPVLLAGNGVRVSGAEAELKELAERLSIPVVTSLHAKGAMSETHPLGMGCVGSASRASANQVMEQADLVFVIGSHLGSQVSDKWRLPAPGTAVIQLDIDPIELGRNYPNLVSLCGDAKATLVDILSRVEASEKHQEWATVAAGFVAAWRSDNHDRLTDESSPTRPERLCAEITKFLPADGILVVDTGHAGIWTASMIDIEPSQRVIRSSGSLGWALPAAIGAKCAEPDRVVVCFTGDGGFYYHLAELETAARSGINPIIVVNNNRSLSQDMKPFHRGWGGPENITDVGNRMWIYDDRNLTAIATELGAFAIRVTDPSELAPALQAALDSNRPTVVEVITDLKVLPDVPYGGRDFYAPEEPDEEKPGK